MRFTIVYAGISYAFVIVGMGIFGAVTQPEGQALCQQCQLYAMDTFPRAWLAILQVSVGNNWNSIFYPLITAVGTRWAAVFWVAYRFFMTDILMNIIEGVMLEAYSRYDEQKEEDSNMQRLEDVQQRSNTAAAAASVSAGPYGGGGGGGGMGSAGISSGMAGRAPLAAVAEEPTPLSLAGSSAGVATAAGPGRVPPLPPGPKPAGTSSTAPRLALRRQRELFDEISAAEEDVKGSRPVAPPPPPARLVRPSGVGAAMTAAAGGAAAAAAPAPPARAGSGLGAALLGSSDASGSAEPDSRRRNSIYGVTQEELAMLEKALRRHEAAIAVDTDSLTGSVPDEASFAVSGSLTEEV